MTPRVIVVPHWLLVANAFSLCCLLAGLTWIASEERRSSSRMAQQLSEARAETVACQEQLFTAVGYSKRISDRLDRISDLLSEGY